MEAQVDDFKATITSEITRLETQYLQLEGMFELLTAVITSEFLACSLYGRFE